MASKNQQKGEWDKLYVVSRAVFVRTKANKVLGLTVDVDLSAYAFYMPGFFPDT